jgi:hypothetical protein
MRRILIAGAAAVAVMAVGPASAQTLLILLSQKVAGRPRENHLFLEIPGSPRRLR